MAWTDAARAAALEARRRKASMRNKRTIIRRNASAAGVLNRQNNEMAYWREIGSHKKLTKKLLASINRKYGR